jgi:uncharacterized repeat protein (TIGR01451 family)
MKKGHLTIILFLLFSNLLLLGQNKRILHTQYLIHGHANGVTAKLKWLKHSTSFTPASALLNYSVSDSLYSMNYKGENYYNYLIQCMNMNYTLADTGVGPYTNYNLIHSCSVVFDTLIDAPTNTVYPYSTVDTIRIDTLTIPIGHINTSGLNDTILVLLDSVTPNDYPTNKVLWSTSIITKKGLSPGNISTNIYYLSVPVNYLLTTIHKFCITLQYYGSKLDTMNFLYGVPQYTDPYCTGGPMDDTTSIGHIYTTKLIANSYTSGWQYSFPTLANIMLPTPSGTDSCYYPCIPIVGDTVHFPLVFEDIDIFVKLSFKSTSGGISGTVYVDKDSNCVFDSADVLIPYVTMEAIDSLKNIVATAFSDGNGNYTLSPLPIGKHYRIQPDTATDMFNYMVICPAKGYDSTAVPSINNNLALTCSGGFNLTGYLNACIDTPKFGKAEVSACVFNIACLPSNATVKLVLDTAIHVDYSSIYADTMPITSGDTLIWKYKSVGPATFTNTCINLSANVDNLPAGDSVHLELIIDPMAGDVNPANNVFNYWAHIFPHNCIGLPYDPNGKTVSPSGSISPDQMLTYTIHFQNTGTAPAHNVIVVDTISPNLDITTLQIISSSSPMSIQISSGNIATFSFEGINLPDTGTSKITSIGNLTYSIKPISTISAGSQITNYAGIYFDANAPVYTNGTLNTINNSATGIQPISQLLNIACFPNPFTTRTSILFNTDNVHYIEIDDITGRKIEALKCSGKEYILERNNLSPGLYFIRAFDQEQKFIATVKIVVN